MLRACQNLKVPFVCYEMGYNNFSYILFKNNWVHSFDYINSEISCYWEKKDINKRKIAEQWFHDRKEGFQGRFSFNKRQIKYLLPKGFNSSKKKVVIFNSSLDEYVGISEFSNSVYKDEFKVLKSIVEFFQKRDDIKFYLRIHPNLIYLNNTQIKSLKNLLSDNLEVIWPESLIDSYELMLQCDKVITFGSTTGIEACFWGRPSILIGRAFYEKLDCCYLPKDFNDLVNLIDSDLEPNCRRKNILL